MHFSIDDASSTVIGPIQLCEFSMVVSDSIAFKNDAANRANQFLKAYVTSPVVMKALAPVDCLYTENSPSILSL